MKRQLFTMGGCILFIGLLFPIWTELKEKEVEGANKRSVYENILKLDEEAQRMKNQSDAINKEKEKVIEQITLYEERLAEAEALHAQYTNIGTFPIETIQEMFLKVPYMLDVDGIVKGYEGTKASVGLNSVVGNLVGPLGKFIASMASEGSEDFAEEEATGRINLSKTLYLLVDADGRRTERALLDYSSLSQYREGLLTVSEEGELLTNMELLERIGDMSDAEKVRLQQAEEEVLEALARLDFTLNVYYDFSRDTMIEGDNNQALLHRLSVVRSTVSKLLENRDISSYGYTKEEKLQIVEPIIDSWVELIGWCCFNSSPEYEGGSHIIYTREWLDAKYQVGSTTGIKNPKTIQPHAARSLTNMPIYIYFSNDQQSKHKAYFIDVFGTVSYHYETDRGEVLTSSNSKSEVSEERLTKADHYWEEMKSGHSGWEREAARIY